MAKISKHQKEGKHSLNYDVIFKGKREKLTEENDTQTPDFQDNFEYDPGTPIYDEAYNNEDFERRKRVTDMVYDVLKNKTDLDMTIVRRKPAKDQLNDYFTLLKKDLSEENFSNVEIFNELAFYFSDNLFSIFKLLNNEWRNIIIQELQEHIGQAPNSAKEITVRNLTKGSEVEFLIYDDLEEEEKTITGVILGYDKDSKRFKVDSFENIYLIKIESITNILNNRKFKHNLNKLNNIDFL